MSIYQPCAKLLTPCFCAGFRSPLFSPLRDNLNASQKPLKPALIMARVTNPNLSGQLIITN